jgi:quercetin dioxygenase-like cupin family protein
MSEGPTHFVRIWADADGTSHLEDVRLPVTVAPAEPGVAELHVADGVPVDRLHVVTVLAEDQQPDWHTAPRRQFVTFLTGWVRITAADGEERVLPAGSTVLVEDTHGRGHVTEHEPGEQRVLVIPVEPDQD